MFHVTVREHFMIAHSFQGEVFGPAQKLHGATYVVDARFTRAALDPEGLVLDIGLAHELLKSVLEPLNYRNLDEIPAFKGTNTTTEFLAGHLHGEICKRIAQGALGDSPPEQLAVTLSESHVASAGYEGPIAG